MGPLFWIKRYLLAAVPLFVILAAVEWAKGTTAPADIASAAIWAAVAAAIFTGAAYRRYRKALNCAMCDAAVKPAPAAHRGNTAGTINAANVASTANATPRRKRK